jgi:hypothetical protein
MDISPVQNISNISQQNNLNLDLLGSPNSQNAANILVNEMFSLNLGLN